MEDKEAIHFSNHTPEVGESVLALYLWHFLHLRVPKNEIPSLCGVVRCLDFSSNKFFDIYIDLFSIVNFSSQLKLNLTGRPLPHPRVWKIVQLLLSHFRVVYQMQTSSPIGRNPSRLLTAWTCQKSFYAVFTPMVLRSRPRFSSVQLSQQWMGKI